MQGVAEEGCHKTLKILWLTDLIIRTLVILTRIGQTFTALTSIAVGDISVVTCGAFY